MDIHGEVSSDSTLRALKVLSERLEGGGVGLVERHPCLASRE